MVLQVKQHVAAMAHSLDNPPFTPTAPRMLPSFSYNSLSELGEVAVLAVDGTNLVAEAACRHGTAPTATAALGRTLLGALLMGSFRKDDEAIQVGISLVCMTGGQGEGETAHQ